MITEVEPIQTYNSKELIRIAKNFLIGSDVSEDLCKWIHTIFPPKPPKEKRVSNRKPQQNIRRKQQRRREYAKIQALFKKDMSRAAHIILDGENIAKVPDIEIMVEYWKPVFTQPSKAVANQNINLPENPQYGKLILPISALEVRNVCVPLNSAPGIDTITTKQWKPVPVNIRTLFYNIILAIGGFPSQLLRSRTVFVPKK